ncbi:putative methyltransferase-domain-containing protein [Mycena galopus ATCC 62051]|nr:putative methyltransferase-domain-containing protein [Mycena galopus ATCC 62051]
MFFYISFLRPPPTTCSNAISITPQIANDLRTELFEGVQDIYYSWLSMATGDETKPVKLTTWRGQSSAYKEIPVPLPRTSTNGVWRLVLGSGSSSTVRLDAESTLPLGVMSMPILLGKAQSKGKAKLQDQIERVYSFGEDKRVIITEQTSFDLDKKIWDSGIGLSSWLVQHPPSFLSSPEPLRILELGAGTGIVSIVLGALRPDLEDRIISTDVESAMPLLQHNITLNKSSVEAAVLDWDDEEFPGYVNECGAFDIVVMADVTYNTASFPSLVRTLKNLVNLSSKRPRVLLGYKERDPGERALWGMAEAAGITLRQVGQVPGGGGMAVEIWEAAGGGTDPTTAEEL